MKYIFIAEAKYWCFFCVWSWFFSPILFYPLQLFSPSLFYFYQIFSPILFYFFHNFSLLFHFLLNFFVVTINFALLVRIGAASTLSQFFLRFIAQLIPAEGEGGDLGGRQEITNLGQIQVSSISGRQKSVLPFCKMGPMKIPWINK